MDICSIPFNRELGLTVVKAEFGRAVLLTPEPHHLNHVGSVHAGVLFSVAEAASGQALLDHFPDLAESAVPLLRSSTTKFRKSADAHQPLVAQGKIADEDAEVFRHQLGDSRRALIQVSASVVQADQEVFRGTYSFFVAMLP